MIIVLFVLALALGATPALLFRRAVPLAYYAFGASLALSIARQAYENSLTENTDGPGSLIVIMLFWTAWVGVLGGVLAKALALAWRVVRARV